MTDFLPMMESHLRKIAVATIGTGRSFPCPMWPSVIDTRTGAYSENHIPKRVYRLIGAPCGSTLYWDQPLIVAAYALSALTGTTSYADSGNACVKFFLSCCVDSTEMFQWGNHQYYDLRTCTVIGFSNGYHELRPITPAWDIFWRLDPQKTEHYIRVMAQRHVYDPATGGFNRHDTGTKDHAFLESGGILAESLAWLYKKTGDSSLQNQALRIAQYSYAHRNTDTGLVVNQPDINRWDAKVSTTEIGLWAQCLLRCHDYTANEEYLRMACDATRAYLRYAYDTATDNFFGQVAVESGQPVIPDSIGYWPSKYTDPWSTDQWPTHDYPIPMAEACLSLYTLTGDKFFLDAVQRWARIVRAGSPTRTNKWAYAENYGRCIHFLARAGLQLGDENLLADAAALAEEATHLLFELGMFQGSPGTHMYETVDGVGYLFLGILLLKTRQEPNLQAFGF